MEMFSLDNGWKIYKLKENSLMAKKKIILMKENGEMDKWKVKENSLILLVSMKEMSKEERDQVKESIISVMATVMRDNGLITTKKAKESSPIKKEEIFTLDSLAKANSMVMDSITTNQLASSILVNGIMINGVALENSSMQITKLSNVVSGKMTSLKQLKMRRKLYSLRISSTFL